VVEEKDALAPLIEDLEIRGEAGQGRVFPEDPLADGVIGSYPGIQRGVADPFEGPVEHFLRGLVGEGENEELAGPFHEPLGDEVGDAPGDDRGFARSHSRQNEERAGTVGHSLLLLRGQPLENFHQPKVYPPLGRAKVSALSF